MITSIPTPVCLVVGSNDLRYRQLVQRLGTRATFLHCRGDQVESEIVRSNVDLAVVLWSGKARLQAQFIHQCQPRIKIILEENPASLAGLGERNGFLSVIERSQVRSTLVTQVESALSDWHLELPALRDEVEVFDAQAVIERLGRVFKIQKV